MSDCKSHASQLLTNLVIYNVVLVLLCGGKLIAAARVPDRSAEAELGIGPYERGQQAAAFDYDRHTRQAQ